MFGKGRNWCKRSGSASLMAVAGLLLSTRAVSQEPIEAQRPAPTTVREISGAQTDIWQADYDAFTLVPKRSLELRPHKALEYPAVFEVTYVDFPAPAMNAFQYALDIWSALIESEVTIKVLAFWEPLESDPGQITLGQARAESYVRAFSGAPSDDHYFPAALVDALGRADHDPEGFDIRASFNSLVPTWYFGTDGNTPAMQSDLVTVVLHEIGHALGFSGTMRVDDGVAPPECAGTAGIGCYGQLVPGLPNIYDLYAEDFSGTALTEYSNHSFALGSQLTSGQVFFGSPGARGSNGGFRPDLWAPNPFDSGSSYSHLDENNFPPGDPNSLMTPGLGTAEAIHDPGDIALCMFEDMGWRTVVICDGGGLIGPAVYFNQAAACQGWTVVSQYFPDFMFGVEAADDFVVPEGENWSIDRIDVAGLYVSDGNADSVNVTIYQDEEASPGAVVCSYPETLPVGGTISPIFEFTLFPPCQLGPGNYWLSAQAVMDLGVPGPDQHTWNWIPNGFNANGEGYYWRDPVNATGGGCVDWTPHRECPVLTWDESGQDLCFHLGGPPEPDDSWLNEIFIDGFETGTSSRWSAVTP